MDFVVFECTRTVELCEAAVEAGYAAWVPVRMERRRREKRFGGKVVGVELVDVRIAAMPGYIFVASNDWARFRRWASIRYNVTVMTEYFGPGGLAGPKRAQLMRPVRVSSAQVEEMDRLLREEWSARLARWGRPTDQQPPAIAPAAEPTAEADTYPDLRVGDAVVIASGLFKGMEGVVVKVKNREVRLDLAERFVTMPRNWVKPKNSPCISP